MSRLGSLLRHEPLPGFLFLGVLLYVAWRLLSPPLVDTIQVEPATLRVLEQQQEDLIGRPLTEEERKTIEEGFIDDEILVREALRQGLPLADARARQRLIRIMRGALTPTAPTPSVAQLQAYFRENIDRYTTGESVTFEQIVFPWEEELTKEELEDILKEVRGGTDPAKFGRDSFRITRRYDRATRSRLVMELGADFADRVETLSLNEWHGPIDSTRGVHLVHVIGRHPPQVAEFEKVERYLRDDWMMKRQRAIQQERIDEIRKRYRIEQVEE